MGFVLYGLVQPHSPAMSFRIELHDWQSAGRLALEIRMEVFVAEQGMLAELEHDEWDERADHVLAFEGERAVGTARLLPDGRIGRMAVRRDWRGRGIGGGMLERLIERARARGLVSVFLHAQTHAAPFYRSHGFVECGEPFIEAGLPHIAMRRDLSPERNAR